MAPSPQTRSRRWALTALAACLPVLGSLPARALSFNFTCQNASSVPVNCGDPAAFDPNAYSGFLAAAQNWSSLFVDPITVNLTIGFQALAPGLLGQTLVNPGFTTYGSVLSALNADQTSADDRTAYANLQKTAAFNLLLNRTSTNPNGPGSPIPYLDSNGNGNNTIIAASPANLKALGLLGPTVTADATITFSSSFSFDFDPGNGITAGQFDFIGVATHEIGHSLGFLSGVDILDTNSSGPTFFPDSAFTFVTPLDLYRSSALSAAQGPGVIDWTADSRPKEFSIDGGSTSLGSFSTGRTHGDGFQAGHWKDNLGLGIMDPTPAPGEQGSIGVLDRRAFDVIGYDLASQTSVPAPLPALGLGVVFGWSRRLRSRVKAARPRSAGLRR